ncbi:hypothetical protein [sulfur-oxidizing endosymbiont of Gigantopelta aegis]|uniref:hypothetical protein n=1 Tax=sulfur-oxidizing endosymbiont of Gigantopelta aegis TaxID=2794934 RepID=UPI0018DB606C|nr:hypothetical protein [sulfur-oxidizing endosymbiont of Gigantopelta aegis]
MNDIALIYKNKAVEDFEVPKLKVQYKEADSSIKTVYGYGLDVPGDYFVLVMKDKVVAIKKSNVTTVIFKLDKNHED